MCLRSIALAGLALALPMTPAFGTAPVARDATHGRQPASADLRQPVHLSTSYEAVVLNRALSCWNPPPLGGQDLIVEIRVVMRPDGTVESARVLDEARFETDPVFRTLAESAWRAAMNPICQPFPLPADRFDAWQEMILIFDPHSW